MERFFIRLGVKAPKTRNLLAFEPAEVTRIKICNLQPEFLAVNFVSIQVPVDDWL